MTATEDMASEERWRRQLLQERTRPLTEKEAEWAKESKRIREALYASLVETIKRQRSAHEPNAVEEAVAEHPELAGYLDRIAGLLWESYGASDDPHEDWARIASHPAPGRYRHILEPYRQMAFQLMLLDDDEFGAIDHLRRLAAARIPGHG